MVATDNDLIPGIIHGEPGAWEAFVYQFGPRLMQVLNQMDPMPGFGEAALVNRLAGFLHELTREDFELLSRFDGSSSLEVWLIGLAHRYVRALALKRQQPPVNIEFETLRKRVRENPEILEDLVPAQSQVLALKWVDGLSHLEISLRLKVPADRIPKLIHRGLVSLSAILHQKAAKEGSP